MSNLDKIKILSQQSYPKGRAFQYPENGNVDKMHSGLAISEADAFNECLSVLDSVLPDNANFTIDDASRWEQFYGLISNGSVSLADRKSAIIRKMNHPGQYPARQSIDFLEQSLRLAGFDVYCYQNLDEQTPEEILGISLDENEMGDVEMGDIEMNSVFTYYSDLFADSEMGDVEMGGIEMNDIVFTNKVVNNIDEIPDEFFNYGDNLRHTFIVGGTPFGTFADVDSNRRNELRQTILRIKPVESVGFLLINYI